MSHKKFSLVMINLFVFGFCLWGFSLTFHSTMYMGLSGEIVTRMSSIQVYTPHGPIYITNDNDLNNSFPGRGTIDDPIRIEGYNITASSDDLISISGTTYYFYINNCLLNGLTTNSGGISLYNVRNGLISNNIVFDNDGTGISLLTCHNNSVNNNTIFHNNGDGIGIWQSSTKNNISNNKIYNNRDSGILLGDNEKHNVIVNNTLYGNCLENGNGISLYNSDNNLLRNNTSHNNGIWYTGPYSDGIRLTSSNNNILDHNTVCNNAQAGINILSSNHNTIISNTAYNNSESGINIIDSNSTHSNPVARNIAFNNGWSGIGLGAAINFTITNNIAYKNAQDGITLLDYTGFHPEGSCLNAIVTYNILYDNNDHGIRIGSSINVTITSNVIYSNQDNGIFVESANNNSIINNTIHDNVCGIEVAFSSHTFIFNNSISDHPDWDGIFLFHSSDNTIVNNTISNSGEYAVRLHESRNNRITDNNFINNGLWILGYQPEDYSLQEITNNILNGKPVIYWQDVNEAVIPSDVGQIILVNCRSIDIIGQNLPSASCGIIMAYCSDLFISENTMSDGVIGMFLHNSSATIVHNTVYDCFFVGIDLHYNCYNTKIMCNTVYNCEGGVVLYVNAENNQISHNSIYDCGCDGIGLWGRCSNNMIHSNQLTNNHENGITINDASDNNHLWNNTIQNGNNYGISLDHWGTIASNNNLISNNTIRNNAGYGLAIENESSQANQVDWNLFSGNNPGGSQALDDGWMELTNVFINNYWSDWTGPDTDKDGIVDSPYSIDGMASNQDASPFTSPAEFHPHTTSTTTSTDTTPTSTPSWTVLLLLPSLVALVLWRQRKKFRL